MTKIQRGRGQRGAAVVEFAIIGPVLFLLIFGLLDFGLIFNDYLAVRNGVQNGARLGAVHNVGTSTSCSLTPDPGSPAATSDTQKLMCQVKDRMGLNNANARVKIQLDSTQTIPYSEGNELVVCAQYPATSRTKLLSPFVNGRVMTTRVAIRIEQTDWQQLTPVPAAPLASDMVTAWETSLNSNGTWNCAT